MAEQDDYEDFSEPEDDADPEPAADTSNTYWAASKREDLASELKERAREYYETLDATGLLDLWRAAHAAFYGLSPSGGHETSKIITFGEAGEKLGIRSNQLRSIVRYIHSSVTADRPAISPVALNNTAMAKAQVPTARRLVDFYHKKKRHERVLRGVCLRALLYGKGYYWQFFDKTLGAMDKEGKTEGDLVGKACSPAETVIDLDRETEDHDWFIMRRIRNRYDAAATYAPAGISTEVDALRENILSCSGDFLEDNIGNRLAFGFHRKIKDNSDTTYEYHFLHRRTPAMPEGRYTIMLGDGVVVFDEALPYPDVMVSEMVPEEFLEVGSVGYASAWDLLGMQTAYDAVMSSAITNFDAFSHNDILIPEGVELGYEEIRDGLNVIRYPQGEFNKPSVLDKFSLREEFFKLKDWMKEDMEITSGANATARGNPEASLKSGTALALVNAQALHFQSGLLAAWAYLIEDSSTNTIRLIKRFVSPQRIAQIAGSNDPDGLSAFMAGRVDLIDHCEVEQINPLFKTLAGKFDIANNLLERGLIADTSKYFEVLETGRIEAITDPGRQESLFEETIKEALMAAPQVIPSKEMDPLTGQPFMQVEGLSVTLLDNPLTCLAAAKSTLLSLENRKNPAIVTATVTFCQHVMRVWRSAPPDMLGLLGYPLPPPPPGSEEEMQAKAEGQAGPSVKPTKPGETKPNGTKPPDGQGHQDVNSSPDQGSGMPSLPKPAEAPK